MKNILLMGFTFLFGGCSTLANMASAPKGYQYTTAEAATDAKECETHPHPGCVYSVKRTHGNPECDPARGPADPRCVEKCDADDACFMIVDYTKKVPCANRRVSILPVLMGAEAPEKDCAYDLSGAQTMQKTDDGYLIALPDDYYAGSNKAIGAARATAALLRTSFELAQNQRLGHGNANRYHAEYTGDYSYTTTMGFSNVIPAFAVREDR